MWEAASYGPVIAFALGYYTLDQVAGGYQRDQQKRRLLTYMQEAAPQVKLGYTVDEVYAKLGSYDTKLNAGASTALVYQNPSYAFGIKGEQVVWRESPARIKPATPSNVHCKTIGL